MDKIKIKGLQVFANHGVFPEEKRLGQKFVINCTLHVDTAIAALNGKLEDTVNYGEAAMFIKDFTENNTFDLIETLAEKLAREIICEFPLVEAVDIEVEKPWAPIGLPLETASVEITRKRHKVYIALGSNIGDSKGYLDYAIEQLEELDDFMVTKISDYIVTTPYGGVEQDDFLNAVLEGETTMLPLELLIELNRIEAAAGRERLIHWGPRTLDLDIIFYDDEIIDSARLTVPHKEMHLRDFVLKPMNQLAPWYRHPVLNKTMEQLLDELE